MNLFEHIFGRRGNGTSTIGVHAMGAYLDEYGRGSIAGNRLCSMLDLQGTARKEMYRLLSQSDASVDKTAYAMQIEMLCMVEETLGPDQERFYDRLFGRKATIKPTAILGQQ